MILPCSFAIFFSPLLLVVSNPHMNKRSFRMKGTFKPQLLKMLCGGVNISWLKFAFRGIGYHWIKQDLLMPVFWHFITVSFCAVFRPDKQRFLTFDSNVWWRIMVLISISGKKNKLGFFFLATVDNTYFMILKKKPQKFQLLTAIVAHSWPSAL